MIIIFEILDIHIYINKDVITAVAATTKHSIYLCFKKADYLRLGGEHWYPITSGTCLQRLSI